MIELLEGMLAGSRGVRDALQDLNTAIEGLEAQQRSGTKKAIAADALAADDALEEKSPVPFLDFAKSADRRERVPCQLTVHGHQAGIAGQFHKLFKARKVTHGLSPGARSITCGLHSSGSGEKGAERR